MTSWDVGTAADATPTGPGVPYPVGHDGVVYPVGYFDGFAPAPFPDPLAIAPNWPDNRGPLPCPPPLIMGPSGCGIPAIDPLPPMIRLPLPQPKIKCKHGCTPGVNCPLGCNKRPKWYGPELGPPVLATGAMSGLGSPSWAGLADSLPYGYIVQGTRIHYEADLSADLFADSVAIASCLQNSLGPALIAVQANASLPFIGGGKIAVDGTVGFDRNSIADIQGDVTAQLTACGGTAINARIAVVSSPRPVQPGIPTGPGQPAPGAPAPAGSAFLGLPATVWGISTGVVLIVAGVTIFALTRR